MKFKVDENLPIEIAELLRAEGHDARTVIEQQMGGVDDQKVSALCRAEGRVLVTLDTDSADIQEYPPRESPGMVVFRLGVQSKSHVLGVARRLLPLLRTEPLSSRLWVVDEARVRIHD